MAKLKIGEFVSLIGNQQVGIFPPKSKPYMRIPRILRMELGLGRVRVTLTLYVEHAKYVDYAYRVRVNPNPNPICVFHVFYVWG